jgi:hypothetical protein
MAVICGMLTTAAPRTAFERNEYTSTRMSRAGVQYTDLLGLILQPKPDSQPFLARNLEYTRRKIGSRRTAHLVMFVNLALTSLLAFNAPTVPKGSSAVSMMAGKKKAAPSTECTRFAPDPGARPTRVSCARLASLTRPPARPLPPTVAYGLVGVTDFPGPFDPANLLKEAPEETVKLWRESELMHGRVGMLAALGFLVQETYHPLFGGAVTGPAIGHIPQIPPFFWAFLTITIGIAESYRIQIGWADPRGPAGLETDKQWKLRDDYSPGDLGWDPLGLKPDDPEELEALQLKELNNGRLAMLAAAGFLAQETVNGKQILENLQA